MFPDVNIAADLRYQMVIAKIWLSNLGAALWFLLLSLQMLREKQKWFLTVVCFAKIVVSQSYFQILSSQFSKELSFPFQGADNFNIFPNYFLDFIANWKYLPENFLRSFVIDS